MVEGGRVEVNSGAPINLDPGECCIGHSSSYGSTLPTIANTIVDATTRPKNCATPQTTLNMISTVRGPPSTKPAPQWRVFYPHSMGFRQCMPLLMGSLGELEGVYESGHVT